MGVIDINCKTPKAALDEFFQTAMRIVQEEVDKALSYLGAECIIRIRDRRPEESWNDITGNLRSSIGYAVYDYGKKYIESTFAVIKNGGKGASEGRRIIDELASQYANVYALVVIAGMNYADLVEAMKNKDVLASTKSWATQQVNEYIKKAQERAERRINQIKL
jgi:hypothetical protein